MITSEPWSSMQRLTKTNKTTLQSERTSALKKDLTGPTLLEISGNTTYRDLVARDCSRHPGTTAVNYMPHAVCLAH